MYIFITQCFASRLGGIESMMTNLALSLAIKKRVKVFADQNSVIQDEVFDLEHEKFLRIFRYGGIKFFRRRKKARDIKLFIESNKIEGIICIWNTLAENPLLHSCRHKARNIRWRYLVRFPYRVVY